MRCREKRQKRHLATVRGLPCRLSERFLSSVGKGCFYFGILNMYIVCLAAKSVTSLVL